MCFEISLWSDYYIFLEYVSAKLKMEIRCFPFSLIALSYNEKCHKQKTIDRFSFFISPWGHIDTKAMHNMKKAFKTIAIK